MTVQEKVSAAQDAELEAMGASPLVRELTTGLYAHIDTLNPEQKALLVGAALSKASDVVQQAIANPSMSQGLASLGVGLIALAGYTNETLREARGETATGDSKVDEALTKFKELAKATAIEAMSPEQVARAEEVAEKVNARIAAGESPEAALLAERAAYAAPQQTTESETPGYGLYL